MVKINVEGFTLLEFIIVIILIGILSIGVYVSWPGRTVNLDAEANRVANDIRYTQSLSMSRGERYRFVVASSTSYQVTNSAGTPIILTGGTTTVTLNTQISFGTLINLPNSMIVFDGKGTPYTDTGSTLLAATASIPLVASGETKTVTITPETGRVTVS